MDLKWSRVDQIWSNLEFRVGPLPVQPHLHKEYINISYYFKNWKTFILHFFHQIFYPILGTGKICWTCWFCSDCLLILIDFLINWSKGSQFLILDLFRERVVEKTVGKSWIRSLVKRFWKIQSRSNDLWNCGNITVRLFWFQHKTPL